MLLSSGSIRLPTLQSQRGAIALRYGVGGIVPGHAQKVVVVKVTEEQIIEDMNFIVNSCSENLDIDRNIR